jgi:hypothetical protein
LRFHLTPARMAIIKKTNHKCWWGGRGKRNSYSLLVGKISIATVGISMEIPQNIKNITPMWFNQSTSGYMYKSLKSVYYRDTCIPMLIMALFTVAKLGNQPWCLPMASWIKKTWSVYTMEFDSDIKKNETILFMGKWMKLEITVLSKIS